MESKLSERITFRKGVNNITSEQQMQVYNVVEKYSLDGNSHLCKLATISAESKIDIGNVMSILIIIDYDGFIRQIENSPKGLYEICFEPSGRTEYFDILCGMNCARK